MKFIHRNEFTNTDLESKSSITYFVHMLYTNTLALGPKRKSRTTLPEQSGKMTCIYTSSIQTCQSQKVLQFQVTSKKPTQERPATCEKARRICEYSM